MKKLLLTSLLSLMIAISSVYAQGSRAVFFSENGERFWLIMNGQRINSEPAFRVIAENLTEPGYKAKIIFQDEKLGSIDRNIQTRDYEGTLSDVTYTIKKNKKGKYQVNIVSFQPVGTITEKNDETTTDKPTETEVKQEQTSPIEHKTDHDDINIKMKVDPTDVQIDVKVNEDTRVNHRQQQHTKRPVETKPAPVEQKNTCATAMSDKDFQNAKSTIANQSFTETQLKVAKSITKNNCLNVKQVIEIVKIFGYDDTRLDFAKYAYERTVDKGNYFQVTDAFGFSSTKESLMNFVDAQ